MNKFTNRFSARSTGLALSVLMTAALAMPANAAEIWKINLAKSSFSSTSNRLVLERASASAATQDKDANGNPGTFLVISGGNVYMAAVDTASDSSPGIKTVDYNRWKDMKLVQIGEKVRSADYCGFRCQSGLPDPRMTLTFTTKGVDASKQMGGSMVVLNR